MTIKKAAYTLCKHIRASELLTEARSIILESMSQKNPDVHDRYAYMSMNRVSRMKLFELLLTDQKHAEYEKEFVGPVPPLSEHERDRLTDIHNAFVELNKACAAPLLTQIPNCYKAIDPFSGRGYVPNPAIEPSPVISKTAITEMATSFHEHPAIKIAMQSK